MKSGNVVTVTDFGIIISPKGAAMLQQIAVRRLWGWFGSAALVIVLISAAAGSARPAPPQSPKITPFYELYIGFAAKMDCVPAKGPYLTELSHDLHAFNLRFVFENRTASGTKVNWFPVINPGPIPSLPQLVFDFAGDIDAKLCAHIKCGRVIKKAWFTKQNKRFDAIFTVIPLDDLPDMREVLNGDLTGDIAKDTPTLTPWVMMVHFIAKDKFAYTGDCIVRHQDVGGTADLEFYLALPARQLLEGKAVSWEFPFKNDDIDAPGTLTVRFIPRGSIK
jgi:hypothetical protein